MKLMWSVNSKDKLSHAEVLETAERVKKPGASLIKNFAELYGKNI